MPLSVASGQLLQQVPVRHGGAPHIQVEVAVPQQVPQICQQGQVGGIYISCRRQE